MAIARTGPRALAEAKGASVTVAKEWRGFGHQKNLALSLATGEWVLSIDADERVSGELAAEIRRVITEGLAQAYEMPRLSTFCGRPMRHSGWYPDYVLRLFRRDRARFSDDLVHERVICDGEVGRLKQPLTHRSGAATRGFALSHGSLFDRACRDDRERPGAASRSSPESCAAGGRSSRPILSGSAFSMGARDFCWRWRMPRARITAT